MVLEISSRVSIPEAELEFSGIRAQGPGGQHVNKAATAVQLRFDVSASSLPDWYKQRLCALRDARISKDGVIVIKAQRYRSRDRNCQDARERLQALIRRAGERRKPRKKTRPSAAAKRRRLEAKNRRGQIKQLRGKVSD